MKNQEDHSPLLVRPLSCEPRPHGRKGFSLVELLVVIMILGILSVAGGREILTAWKRQKLQSASGDVRMLFQRAYSEVQRRGIPVFVQVGPLVTTAATRWLPIYLVGDQTQDEVLDCFQRVPTVACPDVLIDEYDIAVGLTGADQEFCLSDTNTSQVVSTLWSDENPGPASTNWTVARALMCDLQGRTMSVGPKPLAPKAGLPASTGRQIAASATLVFTHVNVVSGGLFPLTRYVLNINPVWSVRVAKQTTAGPFPILATNVWVTQNG